VGVWRRCWQILKGWEGKKEKDIGLISESARHASFSLSLIIERFRMKTIRGLGRLARYQRVWARVDINYWVKTKIRKKFLYLLQIS